MICVKERRQEVFDKHQFATVSKSQCIPELRGNTFHATDESKRLWPNMHIAHTVRKHNLGLTYRARIMSL